MADWISERVMSYTIVSSVPHGLSVTITLRIVVLFSCFNKTYYMCIFMSVHVCVRHTCMRKTSSLQ